MNQRLSLADTLGQGRSPTFCSIIDVAGTVGQFLLNTDNNDLIVELVQNELDAGSARTRLQVFEDRLICEGVGRPIEADGWNRLRFILAAGGDARPKLGGIGAKNHGLRVGFRLGDDIVVESGGLKTELTTRMDGPKGRFKPGAWDRAMPDPESPTAGTRVSIFFRRHRLIAGGASSASDGLELPATDAANADRLLAEAAEAAAARFIGVTHPQRLSRYVLEFGFSDGRTIRFEFSCQVKRGPGGETRMISRTVTRSEDGGGERIVLAERAVRFPLKRLSRQPPDSWFFSGPAGGMEAEVSWQVGSSGRPTPVEGVFRYPISYQAGGGAVTGLGLHISAPFTSDQARHGPAAGDIRNESMREQALHAAAEILARDVVPSFGPAALELLRPPGGVTAAARGLLGILVEMRGLPIYRNTRGRVHVPADKSRAKATPVPRRRGHTGPVLLPAGDDSGLDTLLWGLCPRHLPRIDQRIPAFVLAELLATPRPERYLPFTPNDAIDRLCGSSTAFAWRSEKERTSEFAVPARSALYLRVLDRRPDLLRARGAEIKSRALLTTSDGMVAPWAQLRRAEVAPPVIPGIAAPKILHPLLGRFTKVLKHPTTAVPRFDIEAHVTGRNWSPVVDRARDAFFDWLSAHGKRFRAATLQDIAKQPIFRAADGSLQVLAELCEIKDTALRRLLANHVKTPSEKVRSFVRARRRALLLRTMPNSAEFKAWYASRRGRLGSVGAQLDQADLVALDQFEAGLEIVRLRGGKEVQDTLRSSGHVTATRTAVLRPVPDLHLETEAVAANGLANSDLVAGRHTKLYEWLGAMKLPSADALRHALEDATGDDAMFFRRIAAYLRGGGDPAEIRAVPCVPTARGPQPPAAICIKSTDFWGGWKVPLVVRVPERQRNLQQLGAVGPGLTEAASQGFFDWLAGQAPGVIARHRQIVARHWADSRHGPLRWWEQLPHVACLPVASEGTLQLISRREAVLGHVFLPDFPGIHEQVAKVDKRHMIVDDALALGGCLAALRRIPIPGLREALGFPTAVEVSDSVADPERQFQRTLSLLREGAHTGVLMRELHRFGVERSDMVKEYKALLTRLREVRRTTSIRAQYSLGRATYEYDRNSAIDKDGVVWLARAGFGEMALFEAISERLFRSPEDGLIYKLYSALCALDAQRGPLPLWGGADSGEQVGIDGQDGEEHPGGTVRPEAGTDDGRAALGHAPPRSVDPPVPKPTSFPPIRQADFARSGRTPAARPAQVQRTPAPGSAGARRNTVLEEQEKSALKEAHYAFHCQACLGIGEPSTIAPAFTYVAHQDVRATLLHAHHVDHLQNRGALGAGNLLVLCEFHHHFLGDKLDRQTVLAALTKATPTHRRFPADISGTRAETLTGCMIMVSIDVQPYTVRIFFTDQHAEAWLRRAEWEPDRPADMEAVPMQAPCEISRL